MLWKELDAIRPQSVDESSSVLVDSVGDIQNMLQQESLPSQGGTSASYSYFCCCCCFRPQYDL